MKKTLLFFTAILMMAGMSNQLMAQATENTDAGAVIISPITLSEDAPLHFGVMSTGGGGTCVLSTAGVRTTTGGVILYAIAPLATNAAYAVGGEFNAAYQITLPTTSTVTNGTPAEDMTISNWLARTASAGIDGLSGTLSAAGADTFTVGATLTLAASQAIGIYAGTFDVTVAYN